MTALLALVVVIGALILAAAFPLAKMLPDLSQRKNEMPPAPLPTFICDECGSGPWAGEWDPDSRRSGKKYCPNCLGAD